MSTAVHRPDVRSDVTNAANAARFRFSRVTRGDPLVGVVIAWLLFLVVVAVYALVRPIIRALFPDFGVLISLTDGLDLLLVFIAAVGAVAAMVCIIAIAVRMVRDELAARSPGAPPSGTAPGTSFRTGRSDRGRPS